MSVFIERGLGQLRRKWPQSHAVGSEAGHTLIVVPSVMLPTWWEQTICTVLFIAPAGFPWACPDHFYTDIEIMPREREAAWDRPRGTNMRNAEQNFRHLWPQWSHCQWWSWHLQAWHPSRDGLFTYMGTILNRFARNPSREGDAAREGGR